MLVFIAAAAFAAPNVVFLSVDTLRADHLGCYGYERATSPNIDALATEGLLYRDCVCEVPLTAPSFGSMLSSRFPRSTGTMRNGLRMPEEVPLIAEQFRDAGYETLCVQSNWTLKGKLSGLNRGFTIYDDDFNTRRWGFIKGERYAEDVTQRALKLLENRDSGKPFFLWAHYSDPHAPYRFHSRFNPWNQKLRKLSEEDNTRARYDSEVRYADEEIGKLLAALPKEDTFVLFVADHGESLYEHDYLGHGRRIYQPEMRIPLILRGPGIASGVSDAPARGLDIGPTLLAMAGLGPVGGMLGMNLLAETPPADRVRVVETYGGAVPHLPGARALMAGRPPMRQGVLLTHWKLILGSGAELFDLKADPAELTNLAEEEPQRVDEMKALIAAWNANFTHNASGEDAELNEEDLEALESLGYLE